MLTFVMIVGLALIFALRHNPARATQAPPAARPEPAPAPDFARARSIFDEQGCAGCHAIAGRGNPRHPLDDVGRRRNLAELRAGILGEGPAAAELPVSIQRRKQRYHGMPEADLAALVAYLAAQSSNSEGKTP